MRRLLLMLSTAVLLAGLFEPPASAHSVRVLQPRQTFHGQTYGEWSANWWQWAAGIAEPNSPVSDPTGEDCAEGQSGPVWFLAGTTSSDPVSRTCTVPKGGALLFPIINGECSTVEANGETPAALAECARSQLADVEDARASIDGKPVRMGRDGQRFAVESPVFTITFAPNNAFYPDGSLAGSSLSVAYGYWILVKPLCRGQHTISFHAAVPIPDGTFEVDVTYHLTVR